MSNEDRIKALFDATPEQLAAVDAALAGKEPEPERPSLRLLRMGEAARETGLSRCTLWRAIQDGRLRAVEVRRGSRRIPETELRRFVGGALVHGGTVGGSGASWLAFSVGLAKPWRNDSPRILG